MAASTATDGGSMQKIFAEMKVVPDVMKKIPSQYLKVSYKTGVTADKGVVLTPTQVRSQPQVTWNADPNSLYTLIMTDPDAPSRTDPKFREYHHWLVGNIPGSAVEKGDEITAYVGSGPPKGTGLHRYVFLVYKQPGKINFTEQRINKNTGNNRAKFKAERFATKYKLGEPVAANFYQAQWDEYVPTVHKQLSGK